MFGMFKKKAVESAGSPTVDQIVPRIKHQNFLKTVRQIMAKQPDSIPVTIPFVADLLITFAFDLPTAFQMFSEKDRAALGLSLEQLRAQAIVNLRKQLPAPQYGGTPPVLTLATGNNLEACTLLIDEFWNEAAKAVPGSVVVAVPTRDTVLITSSESAEGLRVLRQIAKEARESDPVHGLTVALLQWEPTGWRLYDGG